MNINIYTTTNHKAEEARKRLIVKNKKTSAQKDLRRFYMTHDLELTMKDGQRIAIVKDKE